jgi:hypothetical protein
MDFIKHLNESVDRIEIPKHYDGKKKYDNVQLAKEDIKAVIKLVEECTSTIHSKAMVNIIKNIDEVEEDGTSRKLFSGLKTEFSEINDSLTSLLRKMTEFSNNTKS